MSVEQITVSPAGMQISRLSLGVWRLQEWEMSSSALAEYVMQCLDLGITTIDHADIYGSYLCEEAFGEMLGGRSALRQQLQLVTKCGIVLPSEQRPQHKSHFYDTSSRHIVNSVENSLRALRTDYLDLLLIHRPDPLMNPDEVAQCFHALYESGKVRHFGVSNFTPSQFRLLASRLNVPLVTNQIEVSVMNMEAIHDGTLDFCLELKICPMAWSPFAGGQLFDVSQEKSRRLLDMMQIIGNEIGATSVDQVALAWLLAHPARIIPILGTGKLERIQRATAAVDLRLSREQWFQIWSASAGHGVP